MAYRTKIDAFFDIPLGAALGALAVGVLAGHLTYYCHAIAEFEKRAAQAGYSEGQILEWLNTGYITINKSTDTRVDMGGVPINYGTFTHDEYLIYGALGGIAAGTLLAIVWVFVTTSSTRTSLNPSRLLGAVATRQAQAGS